MSDSTGQGGGETIGAEPDEMEALRAEVRRVASHERLAFARVAKEAGAASSTFSAWLAGTYGGDNARVAEQARRWLQARRTGELTRAAIPEAPPFQMTRTAEAFTGAFEQAQYAPDLVLIAGAAGVGKTSAAVAYRGRSPNVWLLTAEPCMGTPRQVLVELADLVGVPEVPSTTRLSRALAHRVRGTGGLVIVDEAQHLQAQALDQLRTLHDLAQVGVALVGNEQVYARIEGGGRRAEFAQLFSRLGLRLRRAEPLRADVDALLDAWGVEGERERRLLRAIARKPGALRGLTKTLRLAHVAAAGDGEALQERHLVAAWNRLSGEQVAAEAAPAGAPRERAAA